LVRSVGMIGGMIEALPGIRIRDAWGVFDIRSDRPVHVAASPVDARRALVRLALDVQIRRAGGVAVVRPIYVLVMGD